uniref:Cyanovirin-N domain-containing protein n=1 Tax=Globodera rostochiensis TaxID=31243 RepID=A0A914HQA7_GLORO
MQSESTWHKELDGIHLFTKSTRVDAGSDGWLEAKNLNGCYRCQTGAQLSFECRTDWGKALAKIECDDGTLFTSKCSTNSTEQKEVLNFDSPEST